MNNLQADKKKLINHISRLEGQLGAVKRELLKEETDCQKASDSLCAASRSFASLRQSFLTCILREKGMVSEIKAKDKDMYRSLMRVISS